MAEPPVTLGAVGEVLRSAGLLRDTHGPEDVAVRGVIQDSRDAQRGDLFLAWKGTERDAHDFVRDAARAGAVAAVVERPVDVGIPLLVVSDGRRAAALAAEAVMGFPSRHLFMVGVTGTNGKTTTAHLARYVLAEVHCTAAIGTLGVMDDDGVRPDTEGLTTPGPVQVAVWLRQLVDGGADTVVVEASSHALDQKRLDGVRFDVGVFTNFSQDHLDYHQDLATYFVAKARLIELVERGGTIVVNQGEAAWADLDPDGRPVRTFALDSAADVRASDVRMDTTGAQFTLFVNGEEALVRLPLLGAFNVENALGAASVAAIRGMGAEDIARRLSTTPPVPGRLETVTRTPCHVVIDFAHTPDALAGALGAVRRLARGRVIVVFGAGGDRDRTKRRPMAEAVRRFADVAVITSDNPRTEDPERILDDLADGLEGSEYVRIADRRSAIRHALEQAGSEDTVVLAGKGHETYQVVGREKLPFDERAIVRECLADLEVA
jgi:UDP-N-acetylmuramoyl-L-alanyl-D-glutamate--2,6-diaminopimelate ligase